jgi:hypothetical protein
VARPEWVFLFAATGTAAVFVLLSLRWHGGWSAWWWVHKHVPGAGAIRAVPRVVLTAELFALLAGLLALDRWAHRVRFGPTGVAALAVLVMAEQWRTAPPSFDPAPFFAEVEELRPRLEANGPAYVPLAPGRPYHVSQLVAMWAGLRANVPVVNGYSGRYPTGYPDWGRSMTDQELSDWLKKNH